MTPKQATFVREYMVDGNATQAAIRAGYSRRTAHVTGNENLSKPAIALALAEQRQIVAQRNDLSVDWVLDGLKQNLRRAMQAEPVFDADGRPTGEYVYQGAVANKALELLGKHIGMWAVKPVEVTGQIELSVQHRVNLLRSLTIEELRSIAGTRAPQLMPPIGEDE